jgi:hypothetical protein
MAQLPKEDTSLEGHVPLTGIRFRALLLGLLTIIPCTYAASGQWASAIFSLMVPPVSILLSLVILNWPLRRFLPKVAFTQTDLIVIFALCATGTAVAGEFGMLVARPIVGLPSMAKTNPAVKDILIPNLPDWLVIKDIKQVEDISGGGRDAWYVWNSKLPILWPRYVSWGALFGALCFAMLCINSLMRGAWCQRERLTFPLIQLPVAMAEDGGGGGMWKSRHMWIAFTVMFSIDMLNGLNYLYPNLPKLDTKVIIDLQSIFKDPPLSNMGSIPIAIFPFMAAVGLFMPSDMLFSFVIFFILRKLTHLGFAANGIPQGTFKGTAIDPGPPFFDEQTWGGILAMFLGALVISKDYLREVWQDIRRGTKPKDEGVTHRWAFIGLVFCFAVMVWFGVQGGLPVAYMVPYVALFLIFSIVLTRIRAQLGPPTHEFAFFGSNSFMNRFFGTKWLKDGQVATISQTFILMNRIYRNHPMPYQLEAMKMGAIERVRQRPIFWGVVAATVIGYFSGQFFYDVHMYRTGDVGWNDAVTYVQRITGDRRGPDMVGIAMTIFGFAVVIILDAIRFRFPAFPLHPAGYVLSMNYGVDYYWFGLLIALFVKNFVQRYYGLRGYDKLRMVALGILVAEYAAETIWMTIGLITHQSTYTISFNDRSLLRQ